MATAKEVRGVDPKVRSLFQNYAWPGNIRELERLLEYAFVLVKGALITKDLLSELESPPPPGARRDRNQATDEVMGSAVSGAAAPAAPKREATPGA